MISACLVKRSSLLVLIVLFAVALTSISLEIAHAQSQAPGIKTDRAVYAEPPLPMLPAAGGKFNDPVFGTQVMRATDQADGAAPGLGTYYSHWPTFNCNNTKLLIRKGVTGDAIIKDFDAVNFTVGSSRALPNSLPGGGGPNWESSIWSNTDPNIIYTFSGYYYGGMRLYAFNVATNVFTLLRDFSYLSGGNDYLRQMYMSANDDVFCWLQYRAGANNGEPVYYLVYKRSTDTVLFHNSCTAYVGGVNEVHVDKSGRWLQVAIAKQPDGTGTRILDLQTGAYQPLVESVDHTPGHGDLGTGTILGFDNYDNGISMRRLESAHAFQDIFLFKTADGTTDWTNGFHGSMLADDESWITIGTYDDPSCLLPESGIFEDEIIQLATDGSQRLRRLLHTRSAIDNLTITTGYWAMPKPTISRDGRFIAYTSNWENSGRYDLFIAKIDPPGSTSTPTPTPTPVPIATPTPTPSATPLPGVASASFVRVDTTTQGTWKSTYGTDGYNTIGDRTSYPAYAQVNASNQLNYVWSASTSDLRGLQKAATIDRLAATWYATSIFTIDVNITDGATHGLALYCLDWDSTTRSQTFDVVDAVTNALLDTRNLSSFNAGKYLVWNVKGHVRINLTKTGGQSAVVSGLYFGPAMSSAPTPTPTPAATPTPTPTATPSPSPTPAPSPSPTPSPTPTPMPVSLGLVSSASTLASSLAGSSTTSEGQIAPLMNSIGQAYAAFLSELGRFSPITEIDRELRTSLYFTRGAHALAAMNGPSIGTQNRLQIVAYHLSRARNLMTGSSPEAGLGAHASTVAGTPVIGPADALSGASFAPVLAPTSLGTILGDPNQSPLAMQTTYATLSSMGELPYELGGVSVAIGGRAAPLISVSPSRISFCVPANLSLGETEVIVTLQEGYVSRGMTTVAALAPGIFTVNGNGMGEAVVLDAATMMSGTFNITTPQNLGVDKQTRLLILTSGISNGAANTNTLNDVRLGTSIFANLAESVAVEARTSDGRVFQLPVEFAGPSGRSYGVDQVNVRLIQELRNVGYVELTIIVGGHRSNTATIQVM